MPLEKTGKQYMYLIQLMSGRDQIKVKCSFTYTGLHSLFWTQPSALLGFRKVFSGGKLSWVLSLSLSLQLSHSRLTSKGTNSSIQPQWICMLLKKKVPHLHQNHNRRFWFLQETVEHIEGKYFRRLKSYWVYSSNF